MKTGFLSPLLALLLAGGCSAIIDTDKAKLGPQSNADGGGSGVCSGPCSDGVACTVDHCDASGKCIFTPSDEACDDHVGCTIDVCNPQTGCSSTPSTEVCQFCAPGSTCVAGKGCVGYTSLRVCDDHDVCTMDACVVAEMMCSAKPIDADADGFPAATVNGTQCSGGTDCNDMSATVFPGAMETCNGIDDDCDGAIDNGCTMTPDNCDAPVKVALDGQRKATLGGSFASLSADYDSSCGSNGAPDAVYLLELVPGPVDVVIESDPNSAALVLAVGTSCTATGFSLGCAQPLQSGRTRVVLHNYHPDVTGNQLFILIASQDKKERGNYRVNVTVSDAAPDTCGPTAYDFSGCGTLVGYLTGGQGSLAGSCQFGLERFAPEAVLRVTGQQGGQLTLHVSSDDFQPTLYLQDGCNGGQEYACKRATGGNGGGGDADISYNLATQEAIAVVDNASAASFTGQTYTLVCGP